MTLNRESGSPSSATTGESLNGTRNDLSELYDGGKDLPPVCDELISSRRS